MADVRSFRARRLDNDESVIIRRQGDTILDIEPSPSQSESALWIAPSLFDLQVNGFGGVDFQAEEVSCESLRGASREMAVQGCGRFLLTLVTDHWERLLGKLRKICETRESDPELRRVIAGWHIEGPFLSQQTGYCGAHDPGRMSDPSVERIRELHVAAGGLPMLLTLAPERPGAVEAIGEAARLGMRVSAGHTNATARQLAEAHDAGATMFTHLGNAIPKEIDRHDNVLWRVLDHGGFRVTLIPDSIHVSPPLFRIVHKLLPASALSYVTDAMSAAGAPPGRYRLGGLELEVGPDLVVREPGRPNFAGSALTAIEGVNRASMMLRCGWREAWRKFSVQPAAWMGVDLGFRPSANSEFCIVETDTSDSIRRVECFRDGKAATLPGGSSEAARPFRWIRPADRGINP